LLLLLHCVGQLLFGSILFDLLHPPVLPCIYYHEQNLQEEVPMHALWTSRSPCIRYHHIELVASCFILRYVYNVSVEQNMVRKRKKEKKEKKEKNYISTTTTTTTTTHLRAFLYAFPEC